MICRTVSTGKASYRACNEVWKLMGPRREGTHWFHIYTEFSQNLSLCISIKGWTDGQIINYMQLGYRASKKKQCEHMLHTKDSVSIFGFLRKSMILPKIIRRSLFRFPLRSITLVTLLCGLAPRCKYSVAMTTVFILRSARL